MRSFQLAIDPETGACVITFTIDHMHICMDYDGEEFDAFAEIVAKANLDSKFARS